MVEALICQCLSLRASGLFLSVSQPGCLSSFSEEQVWTLNWLGLQMLTNSRLFKYLRAF